MPAKADYPRVNVVLTPETYELLEEWRRRQSPIPSLSAAVRQMIVTCLQPLRHELAKARSQ